MQFKHVWNSRDDKTFLYINVHAPIVFPASILENFPTVSIKKGLSYGKDTGDTT